MDGPPLSVWSSVEQPPALAALGVRYEILGQAGHGSMGNVYKARDRETGETVGMKTSEAAILLLIFRP